MNSNIIKRVVCILLAFFVLVSAGCVHRLPNHDFHSVAVVIASSLPKVQLKGIPDGKGEGAARTAVSAMGGLWKGCGNFALGGKGEDFLLWFIIVGAVCTVLTPIVAAGGVVVGAYTADPASKVDEVKRSFQDNVPESAEMLALFEKALYEPFRKYPGRAFRNGRDFGLNELRTNADYRPLAEEGVDAVLAIDGLVVALRGKDLSSPLDLMLCSPLKLISTADNSVLFSDMLCSTRGARMLGEWSADQWSALKTGMAMGIEELGLLLNDTIFEEAGAR